MYVVVIDGADQVAGFAEKHFPREHPSRVREIGIVVVTVRDLFTLPFKLSFCASEQIRVLAGETEFYGRKEYPDSSGATPSGALIYAGSFYDSYSQGSKLEASDIQAVIGNQFATGRLLLDPNGLYLVIGSSYVTDLHAGPDGTTYATFCTPGGARPHHSSIIYSGTRVKYGYLGDYTPNADFAADAIASTMARVLNGVVTNPAGNGWYDRNGLENGDKCAGQFGTIYMTPNGARANIRLGQRDYLKWGDDSRGYCALSYQ